MIPPSPSFGLGNLRGEGFWALSAAGQACWVQLPVPSDRLRAIYSIDAGESDGLLSLAAASFPADPGPQTGLQTNLAAANPSGTDKPAGEADPSGRVARNVAGSPPAALQLGAPRPSAASTGGSSQGLARPVADRLPVPDLPAQRKAKNLYREIYGDEYSKAEQPSDKQRFARKLLEMLPQVREHPASYYVLLDITRDVAVQGNDLETAVRALDEMCAAFELDAHDLRRKTLAPFVHKGKDTKTPHARKLMKHALAYSELALQDEAFDDAEDLGSLALGAIVGLGDDELLNLVTQQRDIAHDYKQASRESRDALEKLEQSPEDRPANLALGRYLCFYQGNWENGLPILAQGSSGNLQPLVRQELVAPDDPLLQARLGELWWDRAESASAAEQRAMRQRAVLWWERALPGLPGGLLKIKLQKRVEEFAEQEKERQELVSQSN